MLNRITDTQSPATDFIIRKTRPPIWLILSVFAASFIVLALLHLNADSLWGSEGFVAFSALCLGLLSWFAVYIAKHHSDMVLAAEFQNALFAAAASVKTRFCLITKQDGTVVYFDPGFQQFFGRREKNSAFALGTVLDTHNIAPEDRDTILDALANGGFASVIFSMENSEGERNKFVFSIDPLQRPRGFYLLRCRDYVAIRQNRGQVHSEVEETLDYDMDQLPSEASAPLLEQLLESLPLGVYIVDSDNRVHFANRHLENWLAYEEGELAERKPPLAELLLDAEKQPLNTAKPGAFDGEVSFKCKKGYPVTGHVEQQIRRDASGMIMGATGVIRPFDRAAFGAAEQEIQITPAQTNQLSSVLSQSPLPSVLLDEEGTLIDYNPAFVHLTEQAEIDMPGHLLEMTKEEYRQEISKLLADVAKGKASQHPLEIILGQEEEVCTSLYLQPLKGESDSRRVFLAHFIDITDQKNLEMRFAHSQKMQAIGQLAGGIAHDFNNLLTAMIGFCDLLLIRHPAGDQSFADIMQIKQNANRAANLVRQLLAFSRKQTLQPRVLDLTDVLAEISNLIRRLIGENIELNMIHGEDLGLVKVDQGQMEQVIINLAVNARDAMPEGGSLTIRTNNITIDKRHPITAGMTSPGDEDTITDGDYVLVEVIDTGTGIPKDIVGNIFEPFFSTKEIGSGTGLGLSTVYGIIKQTGGYIFVSSEEGQGTNFSILFQSYQPSEQDSEPEAAPATEKLTSSDLTGMGTLLLVEDEAPVRTFGARALRNKGYTVLEADCGETALELVEEQGKDIQLIVTDVIMPGIKGPDMIRIVKRSYPDVKVIYISGYAEDAFDGDLEDKDDFNFLPKPFTLKQLASTVKEVING